MTSRPPGPGFRTRLGALRIGKVHPDRDTLYDFKRVGRVPAWAQASLVVGLFLATVACTHAEYRSKGTAFGFPGPAVQMLVSPIVEEWVFRGWMLGRLVRNHSNTFAIGISSLLFGLLHVRNVYWLETGALLRSMAFTGLVLGPFLAYVTLRCRTLWPAVVLHYANNLGYYL
ncbi:MAG TPA: CPBP family intramembrane glutamic endopeptidase [Planctomycetota bacterium]|nr:CPBP family intramembrane glutamic endopeptidase [Planctomycetota bacterium]